MDECVKSDVIKLEESVSPLKQLTTIFLIIGPRIELAISLMKFLLANIIINRFPTRVAC